MKNVVSLILCLTLLVIGNAYAQELVPCGSLYMRLVLVIGNAYAQELVTDPATSFVIDLGSFAGIVAVVSTLVTQVAKLFLFVSTNKLIKIGVSVCVGIFVCLLAWIFHLTPLLSGYEWWQVLVYGVAAGLSGCGLYDVVKAVGVLFKPQDIG